MVFDSIIFITNNTNTNTNTLTALCWVFNALIMSQKRHPEEGKARSDANNPEDKRRRVPAFKNVVLEVMKVRSVQHLLEPILEPLLCRVVKEEVDLALRKHLTNMKQNCGKEMHASESRSLQLQFSNNLSLPVFTGTRIEGEDCSNLKVALIDALTGKIVNTGPESSAKVEIVVLEGDFDGDESDDWTLEEFKNNIVREREGKKPLLRGDAYLNLKEGDGLVGEISFTDNSSWTRSHKFRLGARVVDNSDGTRIREARTESFIVRDHRGEYVPTYEQRPLSPLPELPSEDEEELLRTQPVKSKSLALVKSVGTKPNTAETEASKTQTKKRGRSKAPATPTTATGRSKKSKANDMDEIFASLSQKGSSSASVPISSSLISKPDASSKQSKVDASSLLQVESVEKDELIILPDPIEVLSQPPSQPTVAPPTSTPSIASEGRLSSAMASLERLRSFLKPKLTESPLSSTTTDPSKASVVENAKKLLKTVATVPIASIFSQVEKIKSAIKIILADPNNTPGLSANLQSFEEKLILLCSSFSKAKSEAIENKKLLSQMIDLQSKIQTALQETDQMESLIKEGKQIEQHFQTIVADLEKQLSDAKGKLKEAESVQAELAEVFTEKVELTQTLAEQYKAFSGQEETIEQKQKGLEDQLQSFEVEWCAAKEFLSLADPSLSTSS